MGVVTITPELIQQIARDLVERYSLDAAGVREVGEKLAADPERRDENKEFAREFMEAHSNTFDRLGS